MKIIITVMVVLALVTGPVQSEEWTGLQKTLGATYVSLVATDMVQTQHWVEYTPEEPLRIGKYNVWEANPLYAGRDIKEVLVMAIGANYLLYKVADNMKSEHRTILLIAANLIEGYVVYTNHEAMEQFNFSYQISF